jgi:hypothetical protein
MPILMKRVLPLVLLAAVLATFSFTGCSSYTKSTMPWTEVAPENLTPQQWQDIVSVALEYFQHLDSYKMGIVISVSTDAAGGANAWNRSLNTGVAGALNVTKEQAQITKNISMAMVGLGQTGEEQSRSYDTYLKDNFIYLTMPDINGGMKWIKIQNNDELEAVFGYNTTELQIEPLDLPAKIEYVKTEKVNNYDCYVVSVTPNKNELANWFKIQDTGFPNINWENIINDTNALKDFNYTCYLAKDSYQVMRMDITAIVELTPEQVNATAMGYEKISLSFNMNMVLYDHNVDYTVDLPMDAIMAIEHSSDLFLP